MMPTGFDTNDPTVLASLDNILALTEAGDDLAGRGLPTCELADLESVACRGTTRIALANSLAQHCSEQRRTSNDPGSSEAAFDEPRRRLAVACRFAERVAPTWT
jgi:hypothetical protein